MCFVCLLLARFKSPLSLRSEAAASGRREDSFARCRLCECFVSEDAPLLSQLQPLQPPATSTKIDAGDDDDEHDEDDDEDDYDDEPARQKMHEIHHWARARLCECYPSLSQQFRATLVGVFVVVFAALGPEWFWPETTTTCAEH